MGWELGVPPPTPPPSLPGAGVALLELADDAGAVLGDDALHAHQREGRPDRQHHVGGRRRRKGGDRTPGERGGCALALSLGPDTQAAAASRGPKAEHSPTEGFRLHDAPACSRCAAFDRARRATPRAPLPSVFGHGQKNTPSDVLASAPAGHLPGLPPDCTHQRARHLASHLRSCPHRSLSIGCNGAMDVTVPWMGVGIGGGGGGQRRRGGVVDGVGGVERHDLVPHPPPNGTPPPPPPPLPLLPQPPLGPGQSTPWNFPGAGCYNIPPPPR